MKQILIFLFSVQLLAAQQLVKTDIFEVCYSTNKQQPLWLSYEVECHSGGFSRKGLNFKKDVSFTGVTSDNADYYKNVWDKGHLAPAADFNCDYEKLRATFTFLNCALQHEKLNRGPWKMPSYFVKILSYNNRVEVYRFPNDDSVWHTHFKDYLIQDDNPIIDGCTEVYNR